MKNERQIPGSEDAWDNRELGGDANFAKRLESDNATEELIDAALELQPISIRLQKSLIEDFKLIAQLHGMGYQPLMRQVLFRFADCEKKRILREVAGNVIADREVQRAAKSSDEPRDGTNG